tara:strand:+ start:599 stop:802 length:204 start_codon:yes stop_codon:yes gene_type:complete
LPISAFLEVFGTSPILRVLDFLVINEDFDHSMTDIALHSGIGYATKTLPVKIRKRKDCYINTLCGQS